MYVDGVAQTIYEIATPAGTIKPVTGRSSIGNTGDFGGLFGTPYQTDAPFHGYMDEVSIWNSALNSTQISEIYNGGQTTNLKDHSLYSNLVSWWRMGEEATNKNSDGFTIEEYSNNYIIPDVVGGHHGRMEGFSDFTKLNSLVIEKNGFVYENSTIEPPYGPSGITKVHAPTVYTSSVDPVTENNLIAGVVLYNEGFIILTGSWNMGDDVGDYLDNGTTQYPRWTYFASRMASSENKSRIQDLALDPGETPNNMNPEKHSLDDAVFYMAFSGTNYVPTRTMLLHAPKGRLNHSNNSTYVQFATPTFDSTGSTGYFENKKSPIKNIVSGAHASYSSSFEKRTYISKIGIYDKDRNLIAIAKTSSPIRKREIDNLTFKLKLDL